MGGVYTCCNHGLRYTGNMKVAANLSFMFGEAGGLLSRYRAARNAGFLVVECAFPYSVPAQDVAAALQETGLKQVLINSDPGDTQAGELGFAAIPGKEVRFRESLERSISYAKTLGCHKLHIMSGRRSAEHDESAHVTTLEANLRHAVSRLVEENITGLIEPINPVSIPGYFLNNYDTGHVQIAQAPHRHEPSCSGELDYVFIFSKLQEAGYSEYVGAEYTPSTSSSDSLQWMDQCGLTF
ncbi:putative hydroxypyruvate isomerase isoform X6 [Panulirus ornatus]|uniref:putative hydroxypyruvate isomerase isoform X6 n=1 Tax=Panulirus ornatus TaxID=150431 RepID=UPI003A85300C